MPIIKKLRVKLKKRRSPENERLSPFFKLAEKLKYSF